MPTKNNGPTVVKTPFVNWHYKGHNFAQLISLHIIILILKQSTYGGWRGMIEIRIIIHDLFRKLRKYIFICVYLT